MINKELFLVVVPGLSWILFSLGGTQISDKVKGWKGWRRFILPLLYVFILGVAHVTPWKAWIIGAIAIAAFSLPYGERLSWKYKWLVGIAYACISLPIGVSWWNVYTAIGFSVLFLLSNTKFTAQTWAWKICEGFFGLLVGIQLAFKLIRAFA